MLGYICKYTPVELLEAFGEELTLLNPRVNSFHEADTHLHANLCSYVRAVFEVFAQGGLDGLVLTSCCDSARRLYDALTAAWPDKFFFCLDLPRKVNDFTEGLYEKQLRRMAEAYCLHFGKSLEEAFLTKELYRICNEKQALYAAAQAGAPAGSRSIILTGARPSDALRQLLRSRGCSIRLDLTCTGSPRTFGLPEGDFDTVLHAYVHELLNQIPCMRMAKGTGRQQLLDTMADQADGIICHTMKFCDIYHYEYTALRSRHQKPLLKLETDCTAENSGQILTRVEAFLESLDTAAGRPSGTADRTAPAAQQAGDGGRQDPLYILGIDSGSTSTNAVIINEHGELLSSAVVRTGAKSIESAQRARSQVLQQAGLTEAQIRITAATGYGRISIPFADLHITEISCHGKGARLLNPSVRTILDIGGQDSKAIHLNDRGEVTDFVMNDKCAAGTGRFLEMMARTLEVDLEGLGSLSLQSAQHIQINSMCSVFAESEVISLIAQNKEPADIAHGVHEAIVNRSFSLLRRVGLIPGFMMTGGVAKNPGVVQILEEKLQADVYIYEEPDIVGALGAAVCGLEQLKCKHL